MLPPLHEPTARNAGEMCDLKAATYRRKNFQYMEELTRKTRETKRTKKDFSCGNLQHPLPLSSSTIKDRAGGMGTRKSPTKAPRPHLTRQQIQPQYNPLNTCKNNPVVHAPINIVTSHPVTILRTTFHWTPSVLPPASVNPQPIAAPT